MSTDHYLQVGDVIQESEDGGPITEWRVTEIQRQGPLEIDVVNSLGVRHRIGKKAFAEGSATGRYQLMRSPPAAAQLTRNVSDIDFGTLSSYEQGQVAKRTTILSLVRKWRQSGMTLNQTIELLPKYIEDKDAIPSKRTLQRWLRMPEVGALIPLQRGWRTGRRRLPEEVEEALKLAI